MLPLHKSETYNLAVCEALGIDPHLTVAIHLDLNVGKAPTVTYEQYLPNDTMRRVVKVLELFKEEGRVGTPEVPTLP